MEQEQPGNHLLARLGALSPEKQALLARKLAQRSAIRGDAPVDRIEPRGDHGPAPLSYAQELLWLYEQMTPGTSAYNMPIARRVRGALDTAVLGRAVGALVARHESLRTRFIEADGAPLQVVDAPRSVDVETYDLRTAPQASRADEAGRLLGDAATRPFDLAAGTWPRVVTIRITDDETLLLVVVHHIVFDGASAGVLMSELATAYDATSRGASPDLPPLPIQLADFAVWERRELSGARLESAVAFWREELAGAPSALNLPTDFARSASLVGPGARYSAVLGPEVRDGVHAVASAYDATPFMVLMTGLKAVLHRHSGQTDVVVGTAVAGRDRPGTSRLVGYLANTLAFRARFDGDLTFAQLLGQVRGTTIRALRYQDVPYEQLVRSLRTGRPTHEQALFRVLFALQDSDVAVPRLGDATLEPVGVDLGAAKFDLAFSVAERRTGVEVVVEYRNDLFHSRTIAALVGDLGTLLAHACEAPETPISQLAMAVGSLPRDPVADEPPVPISPEIAPVRDASPPKGPVEEVVAFVWRQALHVEQVGRTASFFELGGQSLLVTRVVAALAKLLRVQLPVRAMFEAPTVAGVAAALVARESAPGQTVRVAQLVLKLQARSVDPAPGGKPGP